MGKDGKYNQKQLQDAFEEKYGDIIKHISRMPKSTDEEKTARLEYFNSKKSDEFLVDLFVAAKPQYGFSFFHNNELYSETEEYISGTLHNTRYEEVLDNYNAFLNALQEVVKYYTGVAKEGYSYSFFNALGTAMNKKLHESNRNIIRHHSRVGSRKADQINKMAKLLSSHMDTVGIEKGLFSRSLALKEARIINEGMESGQLSEAELETAVDFVLGIGVYQSPASLNKNLGEESDDDGDTLGDMLAGNKQDIPENQVILNDTSNSQRIYEQLEIFSDPESFKAVIETLGKIAKGKRYDIYVYTLWFIQINILIALKLEMTKEAKRDKGQYIQEETYVSHPIQEKRTKGVHYYRYTDKPAGNEMVYKDLLPVDDIIYDTILNKDYLRRAFPENLFPEDFYHVYEELLDDAFRFSAEIQREVLGKNSTDYSKLKSRYAKEILPLLNNYVKKLMED